MLLRFFSKTGYLGVSGSLAWISTIVMLPSEQLIKQPKTSNKEIPKQINSPEDIDLFEKHYGCKYIYINDSNNRETYNWKQLIKRKREQFPRNSEYYWRSAVMWGAKEQMARCRRGEVVTLKEKSHGQFKFIV